MITKYNLKAAKGILEVTSRPSWTDLEEYLRDELSGTYESLASQTDYPTICRLQGRAQLLTELLKLKETIRRDVDKLEANPRK